MDIEMEMRYTLVGERNKITNEVFVFLYRSVLRAVGPMCHDEK